MNLSREKPVIRDLQRTTDVSERGRTLLSEPRGTRTPNQLIKSQLLYQLS